MQTSNLYETDASLAQYLLFHYGTPTEQFPWQTGPADALDYPVRTVTALLDTTRLPANARALDLGCAVGRSTFELARHCTETIGIDYSHRFVAAADTLRREGTLPYAYPVEGDRTTTTQAVRPSGVDPARIAFHQGDAMDLHPDLGRFDVVHMANLIDRLTDPARCLDRLTTLVAPGGQLLITTPFTWLETFTPNDAWIGGQPGNPCDQALAARLAPSFHLDYRTDLPFLIREHARKYQWSMAYAARYIREPSNPQAL